MDCPLVERGTNGTSGAGIQNELCLSVIPEECSNTAADEFRKLPSLLSRKCGDKQSRRPSICLSVC